MNSRFSATALLLERRRQVPDIKRRNPRQQRAESTVDALLTAASQVLVRDGVERLSTTAVADRAGVSIGSLYQYFGNKDDLLVALAKREVGQILAAVTREFAVSPPGRRGRGIVAAIVAAIAGRSSGNRANLQLLLRYAGRAEILPQVRGFATGFSDLLAGDRRLEPEEIFVLTRAVIGVAVAGLAEEHALDLERLEDELANLIYRYLEPAGRA
jgi:AcrR family transcriptional regulator